MIFSNSLEFMRSEKKSITLMGMSGVGKSYLTAMMQGWGWFGYSCDVEIGAHYLAEELKMVENAPDVTTGNISALSAYIGKPGEMPMDEFKRRQKQYYDAECAALSHVVDLAAKHPKFVNDSTGSICEIEDDALLARVGAATLFVYIRTSQEQELEVLKRAEEYPKPLFYPPRFFDAWMAEYKQVFGVEHDADLVADEVTRWMFPRLFETRLPKYQHLADRYGVSVQSKDLYGIQSEEDFLNLIAGAFPR